MKSLIILFFFVAISAGLSQNLFPAGNLASRRNRHFMRDRTDLFLVVIIICTSSFTFLRNSYNDTANYLYDFHNAGTLSSFLASGELFDLATNPLHDLYKTFIHEYTDNYHIYFFFPAVLNSLAIAKLYKHYSQNLAFSYVIFFSIGTYVMFIAALKQSVAVAILAFALPYAIDRKYVRFYLLVFLAMLFHTHAFMFMFVPFLFDRPWGKKIWLLLGIVVIAMATYDTTFGVFMRIATGLGVNIVDWELFDGHRINVIRILVYSVPAVIALLFRKRLFSDSTRIENLFVNMSIVAVMILSLGMVQGANLFARMASYFEVYIALALPWMIKKLFTTQSAKLVTATAYILFFGYFLYEHAVSKNFGAQYSAISMWQFLVSLFS